ncbi:MULTISPECIES: FkbM family methyltransferase [unclassified Streptomyces]|uniref:FkbM family methyltransferase n=1 Tax=unclassified Streptomyces TaxID=2593676 RepID=UPI0033C18A05
MSIDMIAMGDRARTALRRLARPLGAPGRLADEDGSRLVRLLRRYEIDLVLDVGAYSGAYGSMLRRCGYEGRIVSFEPLREPRAELRLRAAEDPFWSVLPYALADRSGPLTLNIAGDAGVSSSALAMLPRHRAAAPHTAYTGTRCVEAHRLDALWEGVTAPGERVFVRLAVQGYEHEVLRGAGAYADEIVGLQAGAALVPLHEGGAGFDDVLAHAREELGLSLMSVRPGLADPRDGRLLQCELILLREDAPAPSEQVPPQAAHAD